MSNREEAEMGSHPIVVDLPEGRIEAKVELPPDPVRLVVFAYSLLGLSSAVAEMAERQVEKLGKRVSCAKGCGDCCRQMVPLSPIEAAMVAEMVQSLPEGERGEVEGRFREIEERLKAENLLRKIRKLDDPSMDAAAHQEVAREYFELRLACPFLDADEACSIHEVRPTVCREFLVVSPAASCAKPFEERVDWVPLSVRLSEALARLYADLTGGPATLVPLSLALARSRDNPTVARLAAPAEALLACFLRHATPPSGAELHKPAR